MLLKRIHAPTLEEAVVKTRAECGEDALLVETRQVRDGYLIVAAQAPDPSASRPGHQATAPAGVRWTRGFRALAEQATRFGVSDAVLRAVEKAMIGTRVRLDRPGDPALGDIAARILSAVIRTDAMPLPAFHVTALVGGTGVGKTTTLAKLAALAVHEHGERVAIITIDTYRLAAVEQLRAFADLLNVPCEVAFTPQDLRRAVQQHAGADRVFIDTSGRSPHDKRALATLAATLRAAGPACALCLSATSRRLDALATLGAFRPLDLDCAVLTKWDETEVPGEALSVVVEQGLPLSHITIGQEVPQDLVAADGRALAARAFGLDARGLEASGLEASGLEASGLEASGLETRDLDTRALANS